MFYMGVRVCFETTTGIMCCSYAHIHHRLTLVCFHPLIILLILCYRWCSVHTINLIIFNHLLTKNRVAKALEWYWSLKSFAIDFPSSRHRLGSKSTCIYSLICLSHCLKVCQSMEFEMRSTTCLWPRWVEINRINHLLNFSKVSWNCAKLCGVKTYLCFGKNSSLRKVL